MRPYLTVIADSFHAAIASRILWVAYLAIWLILAAIAPTSYREEYTTSFRDIDFYNSTQMKAMLAKGLVDPDEADSPAGRLAAATPAELQDQLRRFGEGEDVRIWHRTFVQALNEMLDDDSWYDAEAWNSTVRFRELRELNATADDELSESLRRRRARLRIEAALPGVFETRSSRTVVLTYAGLDFPALIPAIDKPQFQRMINQFFVPTIVDLILGFLLVLLGVLVTAHIIPDLLQPGSLHLLLSKPISRPLLFLSKFVGGCAFFFVAVIQLIVGLYLITGLRLDVWNARILWCIPVSLFLFAVFFSVSAVAGLKWRSPIVAIGITCIFGLFCFVVGFVGGLFDALVQRPQAIENLMVSGETMLGATHGGGLVRFDAESNRWVEIFETRLGQADRTLAPIQLDERHIATAYVRGGRFNPFGLSAPDLLVLSEETDWNPEPALRLPAATTHLYRVGDQVLTMNSNGLAVADRSVILRAIGAEDEEEKPPTQTAPAGELNKWIEKLANMTGATTEGFRSVLPPGTSVSPPRSLVVGENGQWSIYVTRNQMSRLEKGTSGDGEGHWKLTAERNLDGEASQRAVTGISGNVLMVGRAEEPLLFFDATTLQPIAKRDTPSTTFPLRIQGTGDGASFAMLSSDGRCRIVTLQDSTVDIGKPLGVSDIVTLLVDRDHQSLHLVHQVDRVETLDLKTLESVSSVNPSLSGWRFVDRYVMTPLRTVTPQTGELQQTITAIISGESAVSNPYGGEEVQHARLRIARPVIGCSIFIIVMLSIGCVYFSQRDF